MIIADIPDIPDVDLTEIEVHASVTAQGFLVSAMDFADEELARFEATIQRKVPDLAGSVLNAQAMIYLAERIAEGLGTIAVQLAKANAAAADTAGEVSE